MSAHSISLLTTLTPNTFLVTLHKLLFIILTSKIKPTTDKKKLIYFSLQIFRTPKRCTQDINIKFHHNYNPYIQMLFIQKTALLLIRPLCLKQPVCGFTARGRLSHFLWVRPLCIFALHSIYILYIYIILYIIILYILLYILYIIIYYIYIYYI